MIAGINNPIKFTDSVSHFSVRPDAEGFFISASKIIKPVFSNTFSQKRKIDFVAGRYCALMALEKLGIMDCPEIGVSSNRSPIWPIGWVGSITHTDGFASAAVASTEVLRSLGIDSERITKAEIAHDIAGITLLPAEIMLWKLQINELLSFEQYVTLVFSAKESVYKCLNPIADVFLEFHDVEICAVDIYSGEMHIKLLKTITDDLSAGKILHGIFSISSPFIHTAVELLKD